MNKQLIGIALATILCVTGVAIAQRHHSIVQSTTMRRIPQTPEQRATVVQGYNLENAAAAALDNGQYAQAEAQAREALSLKRTARGREILAAILNAQGKTQEALQEYTQIASTGCVHPRVLLPYALLLLKTGHYRQAVDAYNKQLPYLAEGGLMQANSHFSSDVPLPGQLATALHISLGLTYSSSATWGGRSQDDKALAEFHQALTQTPDSALAYLYYGHQLKHMGRRAEAQTALARAAELGQGDVKAAAEQALLRRH